PLTAATSDFDVYYADFDHTELKFADYDTHDYIFRSQTSSLLRRKSLKITPPLSRPLQTAPAAPPH
ncbi:hypothetical protein HK102_008566, partial [Quaeritorhiza haematococci]